MDNRGNSRANTCYEPNFTEGPYLLDTKPMPQGIVLNHSNWSNRRASGDKSFKFLPYQLSMVAYWATMAVTGDGESGFGSGEGAWEMATTSKEGSRRANCPISIRGGSDEK